MITETDRPSHLPIAADRVAQHLQPGVGDLVGGLGRPLERRVRLGYETTDRHRAADVAVPAGPPAGPDHLAGEVRDREDVLVGLGGQAAHEVQLHLPPALGIGGADRADQILLADHLVDDPAQAFGAAFRGEGQPAAAAVAGELVGQCDVERVHPGRGQAERGVSALVPVGQTLGYLTDLGVVST